MYMYVQLTAAENLDNGIYYRYFRNFTLIDYFDCIINQDFCLKFCEMSDPRATVSIFMNLFFNVKIWIV